MKTVVVESPFEGGTPREVDNVVYLRRCLADCFRRGEAPFASHGLYPGVLDDTVPDERTLGIRAGWAIAHQLDAWAWYLDRGLTRGMIAGFQFSFEVLHLMDAHLLNDTRLFRRFGDANEAQDCDPVLVMREHPVLAQVVVMWSPSLANLWKIGQP